MEDWLIGFLSIVVFAFIFSVILSIIKKVKKSNQAQSNAQNSQEIQMSPPTYLQVIPNQRPIGFQPTQHTPINIHVHPTVLSTPSINLINSESSRVSLNTHQPHMMQINRVDNIEDNPPPPYEENFAHTSTSRL